ncbi:MAG: hypothetical protein H6760_02595 [Candidatus Nomurabacteria bacterium]|nr:MAG: hypothetical protein H6760_02595 [Candidatus Nomurabacteria bacterium]
MFHRGPLKATPFKHALYLISATVFGVLLSLLLHLGIEQWYLSWAEKNGQVIHWTWGCALPPYIQIGLLLLGAIGGYFLGRWWWRVLYIEQRWVRQASTGDYEEKS